MRISDWSSDVCSSDLRVRRSPEHLGRVVPIEEHRADRIFAHRSDAVRQYKPAFVQFDRRAAIADLDELPREAGFQQQLAAFPAIDRIRSQEVEILEIGREACRESGCRYVENSVLSVS